MSTWYVSYDQGSDTNNGLGPDASHATNKPFKTLAKCLASGGAAASGDTIYICPGTQRETITVSLAPTAETQIIGDVLNAQGFKSAAGVAVTPGPCRVSAWTTNDKTAPSSNTTLLFYGRNYYTLKNLEVLAGSGVSVSISGSHFTLQDCVISSLSVAALSLSLPAGTATIDIQRCQIISGLSNAINITPPTQSGSDYNLAITIANCFIMALPGAGIILTPSGTLAGLPGGITVSNCTIYAYYPIYAFNAYCSSTYPITVANCFINGWYGLRATTDGQITASYCAVYANTATTNVTNITNSVTDKSYCPLMFHGHEHQWLGRVMPRFTPTLDSPLLGFGNATGAPTEDYLGLARPSGPGVTWANTVGALGCYEHHDFGAPETSIVDGGSGASLRLTGPGDLVRLVAVNAASTTISLKAYYDANHGATNKPQVQLLPCPEIGYATGETLTMSAAAATWETLTFSAFTPTRAGWLRLRFVSRAAAGNGNAYFDTLSVT